MNHTVPAVESRLDALLLVLKSCQGSSCVNPWLVLHPQGNVHNLTEALNPQYDNFYEQQQPKVSFSACENYYYIDIEGPQAALSYTSMSRRQGVHWSDFV